MLWTNAGDLAEAPSYPCILLQCEDCAHVYEPMTKELATILENVYKSEYAQASTTLGHGAWGIERTKVLFEHFDIGHLESALDIGCADGYLLRVLQERGVKKLAGIEPSLSESATVDGITLIKKFARNDLQLGERYDMIFASNVLEHISDLSGFMDFCRRHITPQGKLFFTVPNAQRALKDGDPGVFLHQHLQHFTMSSIHALCQKNGFAIEKCSSTPDTFFVAASPSLSKGKSITAESYGDYVQKLNEILERVDHVMSGGRVIVHGANNALHNMLSWIGRSFDFTLIDNDKTKQGKQFFGRVVKPIDAVDLTKYDKVLIVPSAFFDAIRNDYTRLGFQGEIVRVTPAYAA